MTIIVRSVCPVVNVSKTSSCLQLSNILEILRVILISNNEFNPQLPNSTPESLYVMEHSDTISQNFRCPQVTPQNLFTILGSVQNFLTRTIPYLLRNLSSFSSYYIWSVVNKIRSTFYYHPTTTGTDSVTTIPTSSHL